MLHYHVIYITYLAGPIWYLNFMNWDTYLARKCLKLGSKWYVLWNMTLSFRWDYQNTKCHVIKQSENV